MIGKYWDLMRLRKLNRKIEQRLAKARSLVEVNPRQKRLPIKGPYANLVKEALDSCHRYTTEKQREAQRIASLMGRIESGLQRSIAASIISYESKMIGLGSIVTGAPFMGLLGTVWGVMDAFGGIALETSGASIHTLAPGVSGALLTTVAGLLVAIPSVFGYNFLLTQTKLMVTELENFASALADRVELEMRGFLT